MITVVIVGSYPRPLVPSAESDMFCDRDAKNHALKLPLLLPTPMRPRARCLGLREQGVWGSGGKVFRVKGVRLLGLREQSV